MMRERKSLRRRSVAVVALLIALCVGTPELFEAAGAATVRPATRTEVQAARPSAQQPGAAIRRQRARRRAQRAANSRKRKHTRTKRRTSRKKKLTKAQRQAAQRRNALAAKRAKNRKKRSAAAGKKGSKGSGLAALSLAGWFEVAFFVLLPFLAVAALLLWTDYQRKPRAPSRPRRKRSLVITPVSRKF